MNFDGLKFEVAKLHLEPDDILVFKSPLQLTDEQCREIRSNLESVFGDKHKILILTWNADFGVAARSAIVEKYVELKDEFDKALKAFPP